MHVGYWRREGTLTSEDPEEHYRKCYCHFTEIQQSLANHQGMVLKNSVVYKVNYMYKIQSWNCSHC